MKIDIVCPLFKAEKYIDSLLADFECQNDVEINKVIFPITEWDGMDNVIKKIQEKNYDYFIVLPNNFSHSLTREKAIFEYCISDIVLMLSQDVVLTDKKTLFELAKCISNEVVYAYGKQICKKKTIEYYIRMCNYGNESFNVSISDIETLQLKAFFASDAFSAYYRPVFLQLDGYDHKHMMMNEDMYYAKKILDCGYKKAYVAEAIVEHSHHFKLKQLYHRYYETGKWFSAHPEFDSFKTTNTGIKLSLYVLKKALKEFNISVLLRWLPDMSSRYIGMKRGKKFIKKLH